MMYRFLTGLALTAVLVFPVGAEEVVTLVVPAGTPLEVCITKKVPVKRIGQPLEARLVRSVYAFDTEVIPAGTRLEGQVVRLDPVGTQRRIKSIMNGDFTPFRDPQIAFDRLILPDGRTVALKTVAKPGRGIILRTETEVRPQPRDTKVGQAVEFVKAEFANARAQLITTVKSPDKWDLLQQTAYSYLPYHPQFVPAHTAFVTELAQPLEFGQKTIDAPELGNLKILPADSTVTARVISPVSSTSQSGEKIVASVLKPVYSPGNELVLPEGTKLSGTVVKARHARYWRRGGSVRFTFETVQLPDVAGASGRMMPVTGIVAGFDHLGPTTTKVDAEGSLTSVEPKTRFIAPAVKLFIGTTQLLDSDQSNGQSQTIGRTWRTIAGASGFGVAGSVGAQISSEVGTALGFYGLGWSVFTHLAARGHEAVVGEDTAVKVRFLENAGDRLIERTASTTKPAGPASPRTLD